MKKEINILINKLKPFDYMFWATVVVICIGTILRLKVYIHNAPFFCEELFLATNVVEKSYINLFKPLDILQVAPPFFLIASKFLLQTIYPLHNVDLCDLSLRLIPFVSSILSLPLFAILVHKLFKNKNMTLVCSTFLALNQTSITFASQFKQYSTEMLFTILLLLAFLTIDLKKISLRKLTIISLFLVISPWCSGVALPILFSGFLLLTVYIYIYGKTEGRKLSNNKKIYLLIHSNYY